MTDKEIDENFTRILESLNEGVYEPAGRGCGFGFQEDYQKEAKEIFKNTMNEFARHIAEQAVDEVRGEKATEYMPESQHRVTSNRILSRIKTLTESK